MTEEKSGLPSILKPSNLFRALKDEGKAAEMRNLLDEVSRTIFTATPLESPSMLPPVDVKQEMETETRKSEQCSLAQSLAHQNAVKTAKHALEQKQQAIKYKEIALSKSFESAQEVCAMPPASTAQESYRAQRKEQFAREYEATKRAMQVIKDSVQGEHHV